MVSDFKLENIKSEDSFIVEFMNLFMSQKKNYLKLILVLQILKKVVQ